MRVWTCTDFPGVWPVGTAAVIVAETEEEAAKLLGEEIGRRGTVRFTLEELDLTTARAVVLNDGDY